MEAKPLFSVIMCTYNRAQLLPRALGSLLAQVDIEVAEWEAIVVDDGSTDGTAELVERYRQQYDNIRIVWHPHRENRGVGRSRSLGVQVARGKFVTFLDSDDEYLPTHLSTRKHILLADPAIEFLHGGLDIIGPPLVADKDDPSKLIHLSECVAGGTFFVRRELVQRLGGFGDLRYADDAAFFERAVAAGATIVRTDIPTYRYYRTTEDSLCTTTYKAQEAQE
jgi:glycosyltransferase involved in cell wall biosynthesis